MITAVCTGVTVYIMDSLVLSIAMLPVLMGIRCCLGEMILMKDLHISIWRDILAEFVLAFLFIIVSWNIDSWLSMLIYFVAYIIYMVWKKDTIKECLMGIRQLRKG